MSLIPDTIKAKKKALAERIEQPLDALAEKCAAVWPDADALDQVLQEGIENIPYCHLLFALNPAGVQISSNVERGLAHLDWRGKDQSSRPYLKSNLPFHGMLLSSLYLSMQTHKQCITALQGVHLGEEMLGFIAADFSVSDLDALSKPLGSDDRWQQFRGDPAVRGTVFMTQRTQSKLDEHIDEVNDLIELLMCTHGVFHSKIHYSSGRFSIWLYDDPYSYRVHSIDDIIDPDICLAYPLHEYPEQAKIKPDQIRPILDQFKALRMADENIYLRSSSINIMNGMLGITFSCDGSHYMPADEFLERDLQFWFGASAVNMRSRPG